MRHILPLLFLALAVPALGADVKPPAAKAAPGAPNLTKALPAGTAIWMKLETKISTRTSSAGEAFAGRVTKPVTVGGRTIIPVGSSIQGHVMRADEPRRIAGKPTIDLRPEFVTLPDGRKHSINAVVVDTDTRLGVDVNDEGKIKGDGLEGSDLREMAVGTGAGATIGAIAGGGKGLGIGAAIGATATVAHWLTKRKSAELPAGTEIVLELSRPFSVSGF